MNYNHYEEDANYEMYETDGGFDDTEYRSAYNEYEEAYDYEWKHTDIIHTVLEHFVPQRFQVLNMTSWKVGMITYPKIVGGTFVHLMIS